MRSYLYFILQTTWIIRLYTNDCGLQKDIILKYIMPWASPDSQKSPLQILRLISVVTWLRYCGGEPNHVKVHNISSNMDSVAKGWSGGRMRHYMLASLPRSLFSIFTHCEQRYCLQGRPTLSLAPLVFSLLNMNTQTSYTQRDHSPRARRKSFVVVRGVLYDRSY